MEAVIFSDTYESIWASELVQELNQEGLKAVIAKDKSILKSLKQPALVYWDPLIRYDSPKSLLNFVRSGKFSAVFCENLPIALKGDYYENPNGKFPFFLRENIVSYKKPQIDPVPVIVIAHKRANYLELMLNSLAYSLKDDLEVPIYFGLSQPSEEVKNLVETFMSRRPNCNVYTSEENIAFAIYNAVLQIEKLESFVAFEEDFILPEHLNRKLPFWSRRFANRLKFFDMVAFLTSKENLPFSFLDLDSDNVPGGSELIHEWYNNGKMQITGNSLCTRTDFYRGCGPKPPYYIVSDGEVIQKAANNRGYSLSSVAGYHLGFNQQMDGKPKNSDLSRFPSCNPQVKVKNQDGEEFIVDLRKFSI